MDGQELTDAQVRGLAQRWAHEESQPGDEYYELAPLTTYEREALLGWVRRAVATIEPEDESDVLYLGEQMVLVQTSLGLTDEQNLALFEAAGWPS